jgi:hypothetical protein
VDATPDPLEPSHVPGQNPNTPQLLPGHTRWYHSKRLHSRTVALVAVCLIIGYALLLAGAIWSDRGMKKNNVPPASTQSGAGIEKH